MTGNPILDNRRKLGTTFPYSSPQKASPNRRRSAITIIPTDNGSARIWLPSIKGNSQSDSVIAVAKRVCCNHWHHSIGDIVNSRALYTHPICPTVVEALHGRGCADAIWRSRHMLTNANDRRPTTNDQPPDRPPTHPDVL